MDALGLVRVRVGEALDLASLAAEQAVQVGADLVTAALLEGVTLGASRLEEVGALLVVACENCHVSNCDPAGGQGTLKLELMLQLGMEQSSVLDLEAENATTT